MVATPKFLGREELHWTALSLDAAELAGRSFKSPPTYREDFILVGKKIVSVSPAGGLVAPSVERPKFTLCSLR